MTWIITGRLYVRWDTWFCKCLNTLKCLVMGCSGGHFGKPWLQKRNLCTIVFPIIPIHNLQYVTSHFMLQFASLHLNYNELCYVKRDHIHVTCQKKLACWFRRRVKIFLTEKISLQWYFCAHFLHLPAHLALVHQISSF